MKITELKLNKIYKPNNYSHTHNLYRLTKEGLEYKFENNKWEKSILTYNELLTYNFEEYIRKIDWFKIPKFTPILCDINGDGKWRNAYLYSITKICTGMNSKGIFENIITKVSFKPEWTFEANEVCASKYIKLPQECMISEEWYKEEY
ncbi:MAG: hypothetical protein ACRC1T_05500 [Clostridium chrysemydis]|uniref:hypothetical protein n=1 Tax=Clostridium chrysemydis TaxID=2665504 RepID=UPI003F3619D6